MINGDSDWVRSHKDQCEKALGFLLKRDSDKNGLIEVFAASHTQKKGSDWIDVIWASWENAFINAKLYYALTQWADIEEISGDFNYRNITGTLLKNVNPVSINRLQTEVSGTLKINGMSTGGTRMEASMETILLHRLILWRLLTEYAMTGQGRKQF